MSKFKVGDAVVVVRSYLSSSGYIGHVGRVGTVSSITARGNYMIDSTGTYVWFEDELEFATPPFECEFGDAEELI